MTDEKRECEKDGKGVRAQERERGKETDTAQKILQMVHRKVEELVTCLLLVPQLVTIKKAVRVKRERAKECTSAM